MSQDQEFARLLACCHALSHEADDALIFIGGIAVYLHAANASATRHLAEATHDGDFYVSMSAYSELRQREEVVSNRRLNKGQVTRSGFEFDVYVERASSLLVPYDAVASVAVDYEGLKVASLPHLVALKLEAFHDRRASAKGAKDARDIIRIAAVADSQGGFDGAACALYLHDYHLDHLKSLAKSPEFIGLAQGNAPAAKALRTKFSSMQATIERAGAFDRKR